MKLKLRRSTRGILAITVILVTLILSWFGLSRLYPQSNTLRYLPDRIYRLVKISLGSDPTSSPLEDQNIPWELIVVKVLVTGIIIAGVFGVIKKAFFTQYTLLRVSFKRGHTIVAGIGGKGLALLQDIKGSYGKTAVAIEQDEEHKNRAEVRRMGHSLMFGNIAEPAMLEEAGINRAKDLICYLKNEAAALQLVTVIKRMDARPERTGTLRCFIHIANTAMLEALQRNELMAGRSRQALQVRYFNAAKMVARNFFALFPGWYKQQIAAAAHFKLVIFGSGDVARALLIQALRVLHLQKPELVEICCVAEDAEVYKAVFNELYPYASEINEVGFTEFDGTFSQAIGSGTTHNGQTAVVMAMADHEDNLRLGLDIINTIHCEAVRVFCLSDSSNAMQTLVSGEGEAGRLQFFGGRAAICTYEMVTQSLQDRMAVAIHNDYLRIQVQTVASESERYKTTWDELSEDAKDANRAQADHMAFKYAMLGRMDDYERGNITNITGGQEEMLARVEHRRWAAHRYLNGWHFSELRNDSLKTHPSLVPWEVLPESEKQKDRDAVLKMADVITATLHGAGAAV